MSASAEHVRRPAHVFELVTHLVSREFRLRYQRSIIGWAWAVADPLARLLVFTFLFRQVLQVHTQGSYVVFVFSGLIAWDWFASGLTSAISSPLDRQNLLLRPQIPRAAIPVVSVLTDLLDLLAALPVLLVFLLLHDGVPVTFLLLPVVLAVQLLLVLGVGYALAAANVHVRDVKQFVGVALRLGFYLTPVLYSLDQVPERYRGLISLNPMTPMVEAYRAILAEGRLPDPSFGILAGIAVVVFVAGLRVYNAAAGTFVDEL